MKKCKHGVDVGRAFSKFRNWAHGRQQMLSFWDSVGMVQSGVRRILHGTVQKLNSHGTAPRRFGEIDLNLALLLVDRKRFPM